MTEVTEEWRNPPTPKTGTPGQVAAFVDKLKERPGMFLKYSTNANHRTAYSKAQQYKKRYPGTEWTVRREDGGHTLFGRWMPF
jgi:hypothetical protein